MPPADSQATVPIEAHHVKKGGCVMLKGWPCKIVEVKTSKTGKHGHAKCNITGVDVLTGRKYNDVHPGHITLAGFTMLKSEMELMDVDVAQEEFSFLVSNTTSPLASPLLPTHSRHAYQSPLTLHRMRATRC